MTKSHSIGKDGDAGDVTFVVQVSPGTKWRCKSVLARLGQVPITII